MKLQKEQPQKTLKWEIQQIKDLTNQGLTDALTSFSIKENSFMLCVSLDVTRCRLHVESPPTTSNTQTSSNLAASLYDTRFWVTFAVTLLVNPHI